MSGYSKLIKFSIFAIPIFPISHYYFNVYKKHSPKLKPNSTNDLNGKNKKISSLAPLTVDEQEKQMQLQLSQLDEKTKKKLEEEWIKRKNVLLSLEDVVTPTESQLDLYQQNTHCDLCREIFLAKGPCRLLGWKIIYCMNAYCKSKYISNKGKNSKETDTSPQLTDADFSDDTCLQEMMEFNKCFVSSLPQILSLNPSLSKLMESIDEIERKDEEEELAKIKAKN